MKRYFWLFLLSMCGMPGFCQSISITNNATGSTWSVPTLSANVTSAGKNYEHSETTGTAHSLIKVNSVLYWSVSVHQSVSANWDPSLRLYVKRTGDGTGLVTISGSTNFIQLTSTPQPFFSGLLGLGFGRENIPIQYKIEGLSVTLPVKTYTATIQYTIVGL